MHIDFDGRVIKEEQVHDVEVKEKLEQFLKENEDMHAVTKLKVKEYLEKLEEL